MAIFCGLAVSSCMVRGDESGLGSEQPIILARLQEGAVGGSVAAYYRSVLLQMQEAVSGRDPGHLRKLIASHNRASAPKWFRQRLADFEIQIPALEFEVHVAKHSSLRLSDVGAPLGAPLNYLFTIPPQDGKVVVLLAKGGLDSARFQATISIQDVDCYGSESSWRTSRLFESPERIALAAGKSLRLPIDLPGITSNGAYRRVTVSVEWLPGYLKIGKKRVANGRVRCATHADLIFPRGVDSIRRAPLTTLRNALQLRDGQHFNHVYLAAYFMPDDLKAEAQGMLIQALRLARPDLARVCMASLALGVDDGMSVDDRLGWLRWWQHQQPRTKR